MLYQETSAKLAKLDARHSDYQFDLDRDIPWGSLAQEGDYFPAAFLERAGVDAAALRSSPAAWADFQWALALAHTEEFKTQEEYILWFVAGERAELGAPRSLTLLIEEEAKHVRLFERYARFLRGARPELTQGFDRHFADSLKLIDRRPGPQEYPTPAARHYMFWRLVIFFEEYTVYLHDQLAAEPQGLQAAWVRAHALHRREEIQHLATDAGMLSCLPLGDEERRHWGRAFLSAIAFGFRHYVPFAGPLKLLKERYPSLSVEKEKRFTRTGFYQDFCWAAAFRRSREALASLSAEEFVRAPKL